MLTDAGLTKKKNAEALAHSFAALQICSTAINEIQFCSKCQLKR
jgi:hypothetical protein